jgi:hypothetical protein
MRGISPLFLVVINGMILLFSCRVIPQQVPIPVAPPQSYTVDEAPYQIIEHTAGNSRETVPDWAARYITGGVAGIESLPRYANRYVFISVNSGSNFTALNQWAAGFSINQDFPQLVSLRVLSRFIGDGQQNPDLDFGRYFESAVRTAADTLYSGARREADFWLLKRYEPEAAADSPREVYDFYILVSIAKDQLQSQLNQVLLKAAEGLTLTRDQTGAVSSLRENFYAGF